MLKRLRKTGVTLIEAVLFVGVALALIVGGMVFWQQASVASRTQETVRLLAALSTEVRALFQRVPVIFEDGAEDVEPVLIASGAVPSNALSDSGEQLQSPWGADLNIFAGNIDNCGRIYFVHLHNMPREICTRIISFDEDGKGLLSDDLYGVTVLSPTDPRTIVRQVWSERTKPGCTTYDDFETVAELTPAEAAATCRAIDPNDNLVLLVLYFD